MKMIYYLRGLGIGILITTLIFSISSKPTKEVWTDEMVTKRAEELGMSWKKTSILVDYDSIDQSIYGTEVDNESIPSEEDSENIGQEIEVETEKEIEVESEQEIEPIQEDTIDESGQIEEQEELQQQEIKEQDEKPVLVTKKIKVQAGMSARQVSLLLQQAGVIVDADEFNQYLIKEQLAGSILTKEFEIPVNATYRKIAKIITSAK